MSDRECITNDPLWNNVHAADRPFPCRRRGLHWAACASREDCYGCVPRDARYGFLCPVCYDALHDALRRLPALILHLRSVERSGQALGERVSTSMERSILVPDTWLTADGLMDALGAAPIPSTADIDETAIIVNDVLADWQDHVDEWVNTREGAKRAIVLVKRMKLALRRFPDSEAEYRHVPFILCPTCKQRSLWRKAPLEFSDDLLIQCGTPGCGYARDWFDWQEAYAPVLEGIFRARDRADGKPPRVRLPKRPPVSDECQADQHAGCRSVSCQCDCHERAWSLYTIPVPMHRLAGRESS